MTASYGTLILDEADSGGNLIVRGTVTIALSQRVPDAGDDLIFGQAPVTGVFRAGGPPSVRLPFNDTFGPQGDDAPGTTYTITYNGVPGSPASWSFYLLSTGGATQRLSALASTPAAQPGQMYVPLPDTPPDSTSQVLGLSSYSPVVTEWTDQSGGASSAVAITTLGATFSPSVTLEEGSGATVTWASPGFSPVTGLTPTLHFGSSATRTVYMTVADANGYDAIGQVTVFNLGFDHTQDEGMSSLSSSYDWPAQDVSAVAGVSRMSGLQVFACNAATLAGLLDFSGMAQLQHIECYGSGVQQVFTSGCQSLIRLCVEVCNLTALDLNPTLPNLLDLRAADQQGGSLAFKPIGSDALEEWHFCVRDQTVTGMPDFTMFPALVQLWIWNTGQSGELAVDSSSLTDMEAYSNSYTSAVFADGTFPLTGSILDLHDNALTSVTLPSSNAITHIDLSGNALDAAQVNAVLENLAGGSVSNGTADLSGGSNAAPTGAGATAVTTLQGRGWTVTVAGMSAFTHKDTAINTGAAGSLDVTLSGAVSAGDLLIVGIESTSAYAAPTVSDTAGNTWTTVLGSDGVTIAYVLSAAAAPGGVTITATGGSAVFQVAADRFAVAGTAAYGDSVSLLGTSGDLGLNYNSTGCGDLGSVSEGALAWGFFYTNQTDGSQAYTAGFQSGSSGQVDVLGSQVAGSDGTGLSMYVLGCDGGDVTLTWYGTGSGDLGDSASAYFTAS